VDCANLVEIRRRCTEAVALLKEEWDAKVTQRLLGVSRRHDSDHQRGKVRRGRGVLPDGAIALGVGIRSASVFVEAASGDRLNATAPGQILRQGAAARHDV
jgi:hypothetical protein